MDGPEAYVACKMLGAEPWGLATAIEPSRQILYGGPQRVVAHAIGGMAGWVDGDMFSRWLGVACKDIHPQGAFALAKAGWSEPLFLLEAAMALRDAVLGARDKVEAHPGLEYAFCISNKEDAERLGAMRVQMGLSWSEANASRCALALVSAMEQALGRAGVDPEAASICAPELAMRLELAEPIRPKLLDFLCALRSGIRWPVSSAGFGCVAYEGQDAGQEASDLARLDWEWVASAPSGRGRSDFPWGLWLAWGLPSQLEEWGKALGARWEDDELLARDICAFSYDRDEWSQREMEKARHVASRLERVCLSQGVEAGAARIRKSL
jgi:hypothetical protein